MKKLSDQQLSLVLSMHCGKNLVMYGRHDFSNEFLRDPRKHNYGCINQILFNEPNSSIAALKLPLLSEWFDNNYEDRWTADRFLKELEEIGAA